MFDEKLLLLEKLEFEINVLKDEIKELDRLDQMNNLKSHRYQESFIKISYRRIALEKDLMRVLYTGDRAEKIKKNLEELANEMEKRRSVLSEKANR